MERNIFEKQRDLNDRLNRYRDEYYNRNAPSVSDEVYDRLFDELKELEQETGIQMANSPTQTVGYPAVSRLEKTRHEIPLLSLDKTKSSMDLLNFMGEQQVMLMLKLDGLTVKLTYENGELLEAATRGDGDEGEIITHNTRAISGIPSHITYKERLVVTGEGFIRPSDFEELKTSLQDSSGKPYKNGRNLAAGSIRLMDAKICQERRLVFMPFGVLEGFPHLTRKSDKLRELRALGFQPCKYLVTKQKLTLENVEAGIYQLRQYATDKDIPIDGIVVSFNDIAYAQSCGRTGHHYKDGLAYKFEDDLHESLLQYIEWTPGRTGEIAPVAVFTPVEIDGCEVSRASLHNLSFIEDLELMAGNRILVSKRNMIIPHVEENLDRGGFSMVDTIPRVCPCCGQPTRIHESSGKGENGEDRIIKTLYCDNPDCETRRLKKFVHFVSQKAMDIEGLSEAALEKFIGQGFIHSYLDIYRLDRYRAEIVRMDGFGEKSWQRLWDAIQQSRNTTFERYLISMDIPMIGNTASKVLGRVFHYDLDEFRDAVYGGYDFRQLPDFGETLHNNIHDWFCVEDNFCIWEELQTMMNIQKPAVVEHSEDREQDNPFVGKTIVVTGKVEPYTRDGINDLIESLGAHAGSSVSKKTDYLVCGENAGSKLLSLFDDRERGYEVMHTQLSHLFTQNLTLSLVYDFGVLEWFIRFYAEQAKRYRGKADLVLRTLMKLPYMNMKPDSREFSVLTKAGYRCDEIILANSLAVWADRLPDRLSSKSITAEKIATACGRMLLNAPKDFSEEFYEYLGWLFQFYNSFTVKYEGFQGLWEAVQYGLNPTAPKTLLWMNQTIMRRIGTFWVRAISRMP